MNLCKSISESGTRTEARRNKFDLCSAIQRVVEGQVRVVRAADRPAPALFARLFAPAPEPRADDERDAVRDDGVEDPSSAVETSLELLGGKVYNLKARTKRGVLTSRRAARTRLQAR